LQIEAVHESQKALDQSPWYAEGGDWTFLECAAVKYPSVHVLIGTRVRGAPKKDDPTRWGEAVLVVADASAGARFVESFAQAFHQTAPPMRAGQAPSLRIEMQTAVLEAAAIRDPRGGFSEGPGGTWVGTKWFLQDEMAETEVYFNYSTAEKRAEFTEKDVDYREDLVQQLAVDLRDGPLPERTMENDPSLTTVGPIVSGWFNVASSNETCQFTHDSRNLIITVGGAWQNSGLMLASTAEPGKRTQFAEFSGSILVVDHLCAAKGTTLVVSEHFHPKKETISSLDPQKLWLVDARGKREVAVPANVTNWFVMKGCLSPDGRYLGVGSWETPRARVVHLFDVQTGKWQKVTLPTTALELVGWVDQKPTGLVLTGLGARKGDVRKPYSLEPATGQLTPLSEIPPGFSPGLMLSPDGKQFAELSGKGRLILNDAATGRQREFVFHPYDQRNVYPGCVQWASDRYLVFQSSQTSLIDAGTLKMSYPTTKESGIESVEFSPDFKLALGRKRDGYYLGSVSLPDGGAVKN
jgi:WD40 repeat protein